MLNKKFIVIIAATIMLFLGIFTFAQNNPTDEGVDEPDNNIQEEIPKESGDPLTDDDLDDDDSTDIIQTFSPVQTRTTTVDNTPPVITLLGDDSITIEVFGEYEELGATAIDNIDGDVNASITISGEVNTNVLGIYTVTYTANDTAGNIASVVRTINVVDNIPPVIELIGDDKVIQLGDEYTDAGATVTDNYDETVELIIGGDVVDTNTVNTYVITYNAVDSSGNNADEVVRVVNVVDTTPPVIEFINCGIDVYSQSHSTTINLFDLSDIDETSLKYIWSILPITPSERTFNLLGKPYTTTSEIVTPQGFTGRIYLYAIAKDIYGNTQISRSNHFYLDNSKPIIFLKGPKIVTIEYQDIYEEKGAVAIDIPDGIISNKINIDASDVNTNKLGTYYVTYNVIDKALNEAKEVVRTVNVVDTTPPVITLIDSEKPYVMEIGTSFVDPGYEAIDNHDEDITSNVTVDTNALNTNVIGTYTVTYNVSDSSGNLAKEVLRTVKVIAAIPEKIKFTTGWNPRFEQNTNLSNLPDSDNIGTAYDEWDDNEIPAVLRGCRIKDTDINVTEEHVIRNPGVYWCNYSATDSTGNTRWNGRTITIIEAMPEKIKFTTGWSPRFEQNTNLSNLPDSDNIGTAYDEWDDNEIPAVLRNCRVKDTNINVTEEHIIRNPGVYWCNYSATDLTGNTRWNGRTITIIEAMPEEIRFITGLNPVFEARRASNHLPDADEIGYAWDEWDQVNIKAVLDKCFLADVEVSEQYMMRNPGVYWCNYSATDSTGNTRWNGRNVTIQDTIPPHINLYEGNNVINNPVVNIELGNTYDRTYHHFKASDICDGGMTNQVIEKVYKYNILTNEWNQVPELDTFVIGNYKITYNVTDRAGLHAVEKIRLVNVNDTTGPIVEFQQNGTDNYVKFTNTQVNVSDLSGINPFSLKFKWTTSIDIPNKDSFNKPFLNNMSLFTPINKNGNYYLWILAEDKLGNHTITSSNAFMLDNIRPEITLNGNNIIRINVGDNFEDPGAFVTDNLDENITLNITGEVDTTKFGINIITYSATDAAGNTAIPKIRTVIVLP